MRSVWRIVQRKYVEGAFSGEGSAKYGGRWNHKRTVVYASQSESLAQLEVLVLTIRPKDLALYVLIQAQIPEELIEPWGKTSCRKIDYVRVPACLDCCEG